MFIGPTVHFPFSKRFCHFWAFLIFDKMLFVAKINMSLQSQIAIDLWLWNSRLINCMAKQMMPYFTGHLFGTCLCNKIYECLIMKHPVEFGSERTILDASFDVKKNLEGPSSCHVCGRRFSKIVVIRHHLILTVYNILCPSQTWLIVAGMYHWFWNENNS